MKVTYNTIQYYLLEAQLPCLRCCTQIARSLRTDRVPRVHCDRVPARRRRRHVVVRHRCRPGPPPPAGRRRRFWGGAGCRRLSSLSSSFAFVDLILARRVWAVVARDNDHDGNGEGGDPPVPNDAAASGGGDDDVAGGRPTDERGGHHRRNNDNAEEGRHIIAGTTTTIDTDAATIAAGTTPWGEGEGEEGAVASSDGRSRCVDFGHRRGRLRRRHRLSCRHRPSLTSAIVRSADICQISADICRYLVTPADIWSRQQISSRDMIAADRRNGKGVYRFSFLFCEKQNCK